MQIVDGKNNRLGWFDGEFINEIPGSSYRYLISRGTADPVLVYLPPEVETYDADVSTVQSQEQTPDDEQDETTKFSLLVLDENQAVQIEAPVESVETSEGEEQEWQQVTDSETKDPTAGKGGKEKKPIGGKPKWKCVPIKEKATEE